MGEMNKHKRGLKENDNCSVMRDDCEKREGETRICSVLVILTIDYLLIGRFVLLCSIDGRDR